MEDVVERVTPGTDSWDKYGAEHIQRYKFFSEYYTNKRVFDAACGTGYGTMHIVSCGATSALGLDISEEAISFCNNYYKHPSLKYLKFDCSKINELNEKADVVVSFETIEHLNEPELFIKNVSLALGAGGTFICSTPNKARLSGAGGHNPFHPSELEWEEFKAAFEKYFTIESCYHQTETVEYLRVQELKHNMHQLEGRMNAFLFNRIELAFRKMLNKKFQPTPFWRNNLDDLRESDIVIEPLGSPEKWHKTFIIVGKVKSK